MWKLWNYFFNNFWKCNLLILLDYTDGHWTVRSFIQLLQSFLKFYSIIERIFSDDFLMTDTAALWRPIFDRSKLWRSNGAQCLETLTKSKAVSKIYSSDSGISMIVSLYSEKNQSNVVTWWKNVVQSNLVEDISRSSSLERSRRRRCLTEVSYPNSEKFITSRDCSRRYFGTFFS